MKVSLAILIIIIACPFILKGQDLHIKRANALITVDGIMDERAWEEAEVADHFNQYFPYDSSEAIAATEVRMTYDDNYLYCIAILQNLGPRKYVVPSLRRDFRGKPMMDSHWCLIPIKIKPMLLSSVLILTACSGKG
jgi:hypothetical protein